MWIDRNLFATCTSGLCNRLLVLGGSMRIAELTGRSLALYWPVNEAVGCTFGELFTNTFEMVTEAELAHILKTNFNVKVYNAWRTSGPTYRTIRRDGDPDAHIVIIKGWSHPRFEDETYSAEIDADLRRRLLGLQPRPEIEAAVRGFSMPATTIGVHVRRGDNVENFSQSRDEYFFALMRGVMRQRPDVMFFLATDVPAIEESFRREFPGRIVSAPKRWAPRHEFAGIREGLIDLLLLARTSGIIGNVESSFSQTAARIGGVDLFVADEVNAGARLEEVCGCLVRRLPEAAWVEVSA